jgi:hypothetical protein
MERSALVPPLLVILGCFWLVLGMGGSAGADVLGIHRSAQTCILQDSQLQGCQRELAALIRSSTLDASFSVFLASRRRVSRNCQVSSWEHSGVKESVQVRNDA